jgi:hypothetical protein
MLFHIKLENISLVIYEVTVAGEERMLGAQDL